MERNAVRRTPYSSLEFMMILHGHDDDAGKKDQVHPSEEAERGFFGYQSGGGHQEDADPDPEKPDQTDVIGRFSLDDPDNERNIKKR